MMRSNFDYSMLGTSNKRKETVEDHVLLQERMDKDWETLRDFYKKPITEIKKWQFQRIKELVTHAYETVPLYNEKYSAVNFAPEDLQTWDDFRALPILTKEELISAFPDKCVSSKHDFEFTTRSTGSSGQFVTLAVSRTAIFKDTMQGVRQFWFQSGEQYNPEDLAMFIYTAPWWVSSINGKYPTEFISSAVKPEDAIRSIAETRPKVLSIYPSYLKNLASIDANLKDYGVELIVVHSEQTTANERNSLERHFSIPVLDEFSSEELTRIALECPQHNYHIEEDACYIEIMNPKNPISNQKHGDVGWIIGTNLLNEATPIIRYHQGDTAIINESSQCSCGSNFRILSSPKGRIMDSIFIRSYEKSIPSSSFMDLAYNWYLEFNIPVHGMRYQIVQSNENTVDVYLVAGHHKFDEKMAGIVKESMYELLPRAMDVDVHIVNQVPYHTSPKYRPVLSLIQR